MQASPGKLSDGTWGVRVFDPAQADKWSGQPVTVESKSGKSWTAVLGDLDSYDGKSVALYHRVEKKAKPEPQTLFAQPPMAGGSSEADQAPAPLPEPEFMLDLDKKVPNPNFPKADERLYVDVTYANGPGTFGPFENRQNAELALVALAGRTDVTDAKVAASHAAKKEV